MHGDGSNTNLRLIELVREVMASHRDADSPDFNACEAAPCHWCELAEKAISEIEGLLSVGTGDGSQPNTSVCCSPPGASTQDALLDDIHDALMECPSHDDGDAYPESKLITIGDAWAILEKYRKSSNAGGHRSPASGGTSGPLCSATDRKGD